MVALDDEFLASAGLGDLGPDDRASLLAAIDTELKMRVGQQMYDLVPADAFAEFEAAMGADDEARAIAALDAAVPHRKEIVLAELDRLRAEVAARAEEVLRRLPPVHD